jgi:hypothetical protein
MLFGEFIKPYLQDKFVQSLQTTGGFALKSLEHQILSNLQVENVYDRLGYLSQNNIIAVSECIKKTTETPETPEPTNVVSNMLSKFKNIRMYDCTQDTGFVIGSTDSSMTVKSDSSITVTPVSSGCSVLNFNGIKIASVHLPGDGPKDKTIEKFLDENLGNLKLYDVDVVLGDTNITDAKSQNIKKTRKKDLEDYFTKIFDGPCVVIMSNTRIGKHRRGFILRNQQLKKSVPESVNDSEADGTIMAIKLKKDLIKMDKMDKISLDELLKLPRHTSTNVVNALEFRTIPPKCLNTAGQPRERVWLDHSVLYISMKQLCRLTGKDYMKSYPRNLIVVNMGSIVNAGHKNWNTRYISYQALINEYDIKFYEIIRKYNQEQLPKYKDIIGSSMIKDKDKDKGVDEMEIIEPTKDEITQILDELKDELQLKLKDELQLKLKKSYKIKYLKYKTKYLELKNKY